MWVRDRKGIGKREGLQGDSGKLAGNEIYVYYFDCGDSFTVAYIC